MADQSFHAHDRRFRPSAWAHGATASWMCEQCRVPRIIPQFNNKASLARRGRVRRKYVRMPGLQAFTSYERDSLTQVGEIVNSGLRRLCKRRVCGKKRSGPSKARSNRLDVRPKRCLGAVIGQTNRGRLARPLNSLQEIYHERKLAARFTPHPVCLSSGRSDHALIRPRLLVLFPCCHSHVRCANALTTAAGRIGCGSTRATGGEDPHF